MSELKPGSTPDSSTNGHGAPRMKGVYLVHASVAESLLHAAEVDAFLLNKLVRRRLNRLDRVVTSQGGVVVRQMSRGLLAAFNTADAAVFGACEMQRRCAVIPQISETQIALKIGIQLAETIPSPESGIDPAEIAALQFAAMLGEGSIVVAEGVVNRLTSVLRDAASPVRETSSDVAALSIDWQRVPMGRLPKSPATRASVQRRPVSSIPASITLTQGDRQFNFGNNHPVITLGRDAKNNVMVSDLEASRQHCKIIYQRNGYVLVDLSTNGTYVAAPGQKEQHVRRAMISLPSRGHISLGHTCRAADPSTLAFEIKGGD